MKTAKIDTIGKLFSRYLNYLSEKLQFTNNAIDKIWK